ncbi:Protein of unknown function [Propionibacterium freudenreichii]|nr:Protein of unknown function [Propionibacterium freudenreichii]
MFSRLFLKILVRQPQ